MISADSRQFVEQRLRLFQIGGIEPLGEPAVNRREEIAGFGAPAKVSSLCFADLHHQNLRPGEPPEGQLDGGEGNEGGQGFGKVCDGPGSLDSFRGGIS